MSREATIELVRYRDLQIYRPKIGDIIIRHGLIFSTKWFGVINFIDKEGMLHVIVGGHPKILFTTPTSEVPNHLSMIPLSTILESRSGSYTIMQQEPVTNIPVWYV